MEYEDIIKHTEPSMAIKMRFYEQYIKPHLKPEPKKGGGFFLNQGYSAWRLGIKKEDIKKMLFVEWLCGELNKNYQSDLAELVSYILQESHDTAQRSEIAERNLYNSKVSGNKERVFGDMIRHYKVFFENEFRLWSTIPYYYICKYYQTKTKATDNQSFVFVGASEKFHSLKGIQISLTQGNFKTLTEGFDNEIRNAGEGHDFWEITDEDKILFNIINPETGKPKGSQQLLMSEKEFENSIKKCRKTIWILKMGVYIFLNNNPKLTSSLHRNKIYKIKEIEENLKGFCKNYRLDVKKFEVNTDRSKVILELEYSPQILGTGGQLFIGGVEAYDLINIEHEVKYSDNVYSVFEFLLASFFDENKLPFLVLKIFNEKHECIGDLEYKSQELKKILQGGSQKNIPAPIKGKMPDENYKLAVEIRVPYGQRKIYEKLLKTMQDNFRGDIK